MPTRPRSSKTRELLSVMFCYLRSIIWSNGEVNILQLGPRDCRLFLRHDLQQGQRHVCFWLTAWYLRQHSSDYTPYVGFNWNETRPSCIAAARTRIQHTVNNHTIPQGSCRAQKTSQEMHERANKDADGSAKLRAHHPPPPNAAQLLVCAATRSGIAAAAAAIWLACPAPGRRHRTGTRARRNLPPSKRILRRAFLIPCCNNTDRRYQLTAHHQGIRQSFN